MKIPNPYPSQKPINIREIIERNCGFLHYQPVYEKTELNRRILGILIHAEPVFFDVGYVHMPCGRRF